MIRAFLLLLIIVPSYCFAQVKNIGTPSIVNYTKLEYNGGTQNWDISQDKNGFMYFANNNGILRFDGSAWELLDTDIPLPVRSVYVDSNDRIFVGLIDNFGELQLTASGKYKFKSLRYLLDDTAGFSDIWNIHETKWGIVFQSFEKLFIYDANNFKVYSPQGKFRFSFEVNGRLLVQEHEIGLFEYSNGDLNKITWADPLRNEEIWAIHQLGENSLLIGTTRRLYKYENGTLNEWDCPVNDFLKVNKLFSSCSVLGNHLAFGSILGGVVISDNDGNIVQVLNRDIGLQNNTILSLFADKDENLWLGLDNGIDYVQINSPISYVSQGGEIGTGYCCVINNDELYLGTNQGLFVKKFSSFSKNDESFKLIKNTEGQVWSLAIFENKIICGHNFGTFIIDNETATKISNEPGGWKYIRSHKNPNLLIAGLYSGVALFKFENNTWRFYKKLNNFGESCRYITEDENGYIWISHGSKGVFRLALSENLEEITESRLYNQSSGLPSNEQNIVLSFKEKTYVSTIDGIYEYNLSNNRFTKSVEMNQLLGDVGRLKTMNTDKDDNLWFIGEDKSGVLRLNEDLSYTKIVTPFESLQGKFVREFELVYPFSNDHIFYAIDNGFAHYSSQFSKSYNQNFEAFITDVELSNIDSVISPQNMQSGQNFEFPFKQNSFRFHYTSPFFENISNLQFSYKLEHYSEKWSEWTSDSYKDFTNLNEGEYTFKVKAKNVYGTESEVSEFNFHITPPWHRSIVAYYIYLAFFIVLIILLVKFILYRIELAKKREILKHEKEIKAQEEQFQHQSVLAEKEIIKLRNDKLRAEMVHRDKELANQTMGLIQKNKLLINITEELQYIHNLIKNESAKTKIFSLKKRINKEIDNKQQNQIFQTYFDEVHDEYFKRLKEQYPVLTPNDLRLCAFIKMNISTKEIATILNISYRGAEISRYRLRKKLELSREISLSTYLSGI
jgi:ligand-binding sensor domain-containing protein/DNA-binding CsgD family transcriptional regulator